jgi:hypothetical protein
MVRGESYYVAAAVPTDTADEIQIVFTITPDAVSRVNSPDNLLQEPSWEGTGLQSQYWHICGPAGIGGYVNEWGGADGAEVFP